MFQITNQKTNRQWILHTVPLGFYYGAPHAFGVTEPSPEVLWSAAGLPTWIPATPKRHTTGREHLSFPQLITYKQSKKPYTFFAQMKMIVGTLTLFFRFFTTIEIQSPSYSMKSHLENVLSPQPWQLRTPRTNLPPGCAACRTPSAR